MNSQLAVDTNVLIYLHDKSNDKKRKAAEEILAENPRIPAQVVSEYLNVTRRLLNLSKKDIVQQCAQLLEGCEIIPTDQNVLLNAVTLIEKYDLQIFDAIIVAAALEANCSVLYSEDMHNGLIINNLTIINPFLKP